MADPSFDADIHPCVRCSIVEDEHRGVTLPCPCGQSIYLCSSCLWELFRAVARTEPGPLETDFHPDLPTEDDGPPLGDTPQTVRARIVASDRHLLPAEERDADDGPPLGATLRAIRARIVASGARLLTADELDEERHDR